VVKSLSVIWCPQRRSFSRKSAHRKAMFDNLAMPSSDEQITTTLPKAKDLRPGRGEADQPWQARRACTPPPRRWRRCRNTKDHDKLFTTLAER